MKKVSTPNAPAAIGPYSQGIIAGGLLFASGQIPLDPATGTIVSGGIEAQAHQAFTNVKNLVEAAGTTMSAVLKVTVFMADMADFAAVNAIYAQYFTEPYPARSAVAVKSLPKGALIEVEVIARMAE
ncbi:MAG: RidA family protein [Prevotellaceae bacterium]|nr:RidA family protein [Prevotellaceae bacterium]MDY2749757.1 RidA family protein [Prevotella sp.]